MRILKFLLALGLTSALIWALSTSHLVGGKPLPPIGSFFNPFSGFWKNAEPLSGPKFSDCNIPGLKGKVKVVYDNLLVPHIFADNTEDAMRVQGYVTAQHRLFQMDLTTRKASGRLSEVLGERTFNVDRATRRKGLPYAAENDLIGWGKSPETMALLKAYAEGVNAWIDQLSPADLPVEYKLLNFKPEHWNPLKTALISEAMAETLSSREDDIESTNALAQYGRPTFDYLFPTWNPKQQPVVTDTGQWKDIHVLMPPPAPEAAQPASDAVGFSSKRELPEVPELDHYRVGSNNWAISGGKSKSGHAILANDPHLNLTLPSIWFQVQLHTPEFNTYGVSLPGVPGVIIGFNENIAWGITNVGQDVADYYTVKWTDANHTKYQLDEEIKTAVMRVEEIGIKGKPVFRDTVRYTVWGPMQFDNEADNPLKDCALRWTAHDIPERSAVDIFLGLMRGKSFDDYKKALVGFDSPAQNFVFASRSGDVGITVEGKIPVRGKDQGRFVQDGSKWINGWHSFIPWDQVPCMKNPSRGFVFSANQHSVPPTFPYNIVGDFEDYRSRRIFDRLTAMHEATADSMKTMQLDNFSQKAADALPAMLKLLDRNALNDAEKKMVDVMSAWNYKYDADQIAPTYFDAWVDSCYLLTWDEMDAVRKQNKPILFPDGWRWIEMLQSDTSSIFFDIKATPARETARDVVLESFKQMEDYFVKHPDKNANWGDSRKFMLKHLALIDGFSRFDLKTGGHKTAPNAINATHGPSWRMIVELDDEVKAQGVYPGGQSGNPGSKWYDNMAETWAKGEYYPLLFMKSPEEKSDRVVATQTFSPK